MTALCLRTPKLGSSQLLGDVVGLIQGTSPVRYGNWTRDYCLWSLYLYICPPIRKTVFVMVTNVTDSTFLCAHHEGICGRISIPPIFFRSYLFHPRGKHPWYTLWDPQISQDLNYDSLNQKCNKERTDKLFVVTKLYINVYLSCTWKISLYAWKFLENSILFSGCHYIQNSSLSEIVFC